ncbi:MAG: cobalt ECF transporter T component CbiQ [Dehalococcoidia bacterium]|nr:cobalt ECF transporter T component CbiQ [Dehalococcoidia bacterium]
MEHSFIDQYSTLDSLIHRLDPRTKVIAAIAFVLAVVVTPITEWPALLGYFAFIGILTLMSRLPILYVVKRVLLIIPFVVLIGVFNIFRTGEPLATVHVWHWQLSVTHEGLLTFANVSAKAIICSLALVLLSSTTSFTNLLRAMQTLRMPKVLVMTLSFAYRYLFVLIDEAMRMWRARDSRNFGGRWIWQIGTIGNMIGTLFIRSYERGERVYAAMVSRGYEGQVRGMDSLSFAPVDAWFAAIGMLFLAAMCILVVLW